MSRGFGVACLSWLLAGCGSQGPTGERPLQPTTTAGRGSEVAIQALVHAQVLVPAGVFHMGSAQGRADELPVHEVWLDSFYIDQYEVSVAQYRRCVAAGVCEEPTIVNLCNWDGGVPDTHPINCMTWTSAQAYCEWAGLRLPTEAEWEQAARGADGRTYPWGEGTGHDLANYREGSGRATEPVGSHPEGTSPYGVHDLAGNVWEWVADWHAPDYYARSPRANPPGPLHGDRRVLRGGSWWFEAPYLRSALREPYEPLVTDIDIGFRCARDL